MSDEVDQLEGELPLEGAGQRLMRAREDAGTTLAEIAAETRIPIRHLETLESGDFAALPAKTYAIGFARTYAKAVGLDQQEIAAQVRDELGAHDGTESHRSVTFEPGDPARLPSRGLAWFSVFAVVLLIVGALAFFRGYFIPGSGPGSIIAPEDAPAALVSGEGAGETAGASAVATETPSGAVVLTSLEEGLWVRFSDAAGETLMEKQMTQGESYTVPADADGPQIRTGQPESLTIRVGGKSIGTLSNRSEVVSGISLTADALVARMGELEAEAAAEAAATANPAE